MNKIKAYPAACKFASYQRTAKHVTSSDSHHLGPNCPQFPTSQKRIDRKAMRRGHQITPSYWIGIIQLLHCRHIWWWRRHGTSRTPGGFLSSLCRWRGVIKQKEWKVLHGMDVMLAVVGQAESRPIVRPVTCLVLPIVYSYGCRTKVTVPHKDIIKLGRPLSVISVW